MESVKMFVCPPILNVAPLLQLYKGVLFRDLNNGVEGKVKAVEDDEDDDVVAAFGESVVG